MFRLWPRTLVTISDAEHFQVETEKASLQEMTNVIFDFLEIVWKIIYLLTDLLTEWLLESRNLP